MPRLWEGTCADQDLQCLTRCLSTLYTLTAAVCTYSCTRANVRVKSQSPVRIRTSQCLTSCLSTPLHLDCRGLHVLVYKGQCKSEETFERSRLLARVMPFQQYRCLEYTCIPPFTKLGNAPPGLNAHINPSMSCQVYINLIY